MAMLGVLPGTLSYHVNELNRNENWYGLDIKSIIVAISVAPIYPQPRNTFSSLSPQGQD